MNLLLLDFETQSDDPKTTNPTEIGAISVEHTAEGFSLLGDMSQLIYANHYPPQTEEIVDITGITDEMLKTDGQDPESVFTVLSEMIARSDYALAHNAAFDRDVYEGTAKRLGMVPSQPKSGWLCTVQDIPWPKKYKCRKLSHLAYDHGILVDPKTLHRALDDVKLLYALVRSCGLSFEEILKYRNTPWAYLRAVVPAPWEDGGVGTGQAKKLGYSWEKIFGTEVVYTKRWVKRVKEDQIEAEKARCPFKLMRLTIE